MDLRARELMAVAAGAALGLTLYVPLYVPAPRDSGDWAAWVQGIGTIVAVAIAAWAGTIPLRLDHAARRRRRRDFISAVVDAAAYALTEVGMTQQAIRAKDGTDLFVAHYSRHSHRGVRALEKLLEEPISTWPTHGLYVRTAEFAAALQDLVGLDPEILKDTPQMFWAAGRLASNRVDGTHQALTNLILRMD